MRLLDVEREDLVGHLALRHHQREDRFRAQLLERSQPMAAVRRAEAVLLAHGDDGIEVAPRLVHRPRQLEHVRVGDVALEGSRFDLVHRERGEEQRMSAERLAVGGQHRAALFFDGRGQFLQLGRRRFQTELRRLQLGGLELHSLAGTRLARLRHRTFSR